jgi:hypothetical protein
MVEWLSERAKLGFPVHARMLRHACGFKMANERRQYPDDPGVSRPQGTIRCAAPRLSPVRFKGLWKD